MSDFISKILAVFPKEVKDNWILIVLAIIGFVYLFKYFNSKGMYGSEMMESNDQPAYQNERKNGPLPAEDIEVKGNERYSDVAGGQSGVQGIAGQGDLANINLLKAGYHIGIDTVGQSLRNANLQIRSEPPNPQVNTGPWNASTITHDFLRPSLEIGQGTQ